MISALRQRLKKRGMQWICDVVFCVGCALQLTAFVLRGGGETRIFQLLGIASGTLLYAVFFSHFLRPLWALLAESMLQAGRILLLPIYLFFWGAKKSLKFSKNSFHFYVKCIIIKNYKREAMLRKSWSSEGGVHCAKKNGKKEAQGKCFDSFAVGNAAAGDRMGIGGTAGTAQRSKGARGADPSIGGGRKTGD